MSLVYQAYAESYPYKADLTSQKEVPPGKSIATGKAEFTAPSKGIIKYRVNITGISNASGAHIYAGSEGENGKIVADLLHTPTSQDKDTDYGMIFRGSIDDSSLKGPMQGKTVNDLGAAMNSGKIYLNVQTTGNPDGEIRDQLIKNGQITKNGTSFEDQYGGPSKNSLETIEAFCISADINNYKNKDKIVRELVNNGTISTFYADWNCKKVEKQIKAFEDLSESFSDFTTMNDIQNKIKHNNETFDDLGRLEVIKNKYKDK